MLDKLVLKLVVLEFVVPCFVLSVLKKSSYLPFSCSYAMRFIAMQLRLALVAKFPDAPQDDILKVIGNLLYYRYMNPAIVAPDAFDVVEMGVEQQLGAEQRRNLGAIAKILQTAAAGKIVCFFCCVLILYVFLCVPPRNCFDLLN